MKILSNLTVIIALLTGFQMLSQDKIPEILTDEYLSSFKLYDHTQPATGDITYIVDNVNFYDMDLKRIPKTKVSDYRLNSDFAIDRMYINDKKFVEIIIYKKSSPQEKAAKEKTLESLREKDPTDLRGTYPKPFNLQDLNGNIYTLESLKGKVVLINFWFVGCVPCEKEIPILNEIAKKYKNEDVVFLALTFDDYDKVNSFLAKTNFEFQVVPEAHKMIDDFQIKMYPSHLLIDKKLLVRYVGMLPDGLVKAKIEESLDILLSE